MVEPAQRRLRKQVVAGVLASVLVLAALVFAAFWPATIFGVNGKALHNSIDVLGKGDCEPLWNDKWWCRGKGSYHGGTAYFVVQADSFGCWTAYREKPNGDTRRTPSRSGCIRIVSYLT